MRRALLLILVALSLSGCVGEAARRSIEALSKSDRSWCVNVSTIYGTLRASGSGIEGGTVNCSAEGHVVRDRQEPVRR